MKFAAFDIEIAKELPEGETDWRKHAPLGISCAAIARRGENGQFETEFFHAPGSLGFGDVAGLVLRLHDLALAGYTILTWNGCGFDFQVLAQESGFDRICGEIALNHVDLMLEVTFRKGHYLGLDKALAGAGIEGKLHNVALKDGTLISDMGGAKAPEYWAAGEYDAVLAYLRRDVESLLELAEWIDQNKAIRWRSSSNKPQAVQVARFSTVEQLFRLPEPDTSWMDNPPKRAQFVEWIPAVEKEAVK